MTITQDIKKSAENGVDEVKKIAGEGRKPFFAIIGLNDLFIEQSKAAAERTQERLDAYRDGVIANFTTVREELEKALVEGRERATELQKAWTETDSHDIQAGVQEYLNTVMRSYASLVERGERIFEQMSAALAESPVVRRATEVGQGVAKQVEEAAAQAEARVRLTVAAVADQGVDVAAKAADKVEKAADKVATEVAETADKAATEVTEAAVKVEEAAAKPVAAQETIDVAVAEKTPARKTPARKTAPRKTTTRKAAPRKAAAKTTAAKSTPAKAADKPAAAEGATDSE